MDRDEKPNLLSIFAVLIGLAAFGLAALAMIVVVVVDDDDAADGAAGGDGVATAEVALADDFTIEPDPISVGVGGTLKVTNTGAVDHNLVVDGGPKTANLVGGASAELVLADLAAGSYTVYCSIPGHRDAGMEATLEVTSGGGGGDANDGDGGGNADHGDEPDYAAMDEAMQKSIARFLEPEAKTDVSGNQPLTPEVTTEGGRTVKSFALTAEIIDWEVEAGRSVKAWAYNGQVPGPVIKVQQGDLVRITITNKLPMNTDIHVHGVDLPNTMDGVAPLTQDPVKPGETFTYEFVAMNRPAVAMYHAHNHAQMQVPNGLFGAFMIGDLALPTGRTIGGIPVPADLEVAQEIPIVLNDTGVIGYAINGKSFPSTDAFAATTGDWVLVHYFNEGGQIHPMHPHQFEQLIVAKDGIPLDQPYWADTLNVAPGERYSVLMHLDTPGAWVWHCHILNHVERETGAFGMITALVVTDPEPANA